MSILHTVNKSPFERNSLASCLKVAAPGAAVLLIEDGVYAGLRGTSAVPLVTAALARVKVYVLGPDLKARGFAAERLLPGIDVVDYAGFVELAVQSAKVQAWL
ncbi:sulfurtransferase complex subunit TusB [uncultured Thiodictyon sp.]|uniref:sulfurtransferase complex subunit TusB n=1 Tax=uncultured Thiodictyon sp. TaxID=1846217 RepID=UPI0025FD8E29|nr:sulfurtransferase complex subunit TusB [uncultured Thiodictyon sp.]